jgi:hypothetical protein
MPKADFSITLRFREMPVQDDVDRDYLAHDIRQVAIDTAVGSMCEAWRTAFQRDETVVDVAEVHEDSWDTYSVAVSLTLVGNVRVNSNGSGYDEVQEWANNIASRHLVPAGSVYVWGTEFTPEDSVEVNVEHEGPWNENTAILAVS